MRFESRTHRRSSRQPAGRRRRGRLPRASHSRRLRRVPRTLGDLADPAALALLSGIVSPRGRPRYDIALLGLLKELSAVIVLLWIGSGLTALASESSLRR